LIRYSHSVITGNTNLPSVGTGPTLVGTGSQSSPEIPSTPTSMIRLPVTRGRYAVLPVDVRGPFSDTAINTPESSIIPE
jgi:hypothetical protein